LAAPVNEAQVPASIPYGAKKSRCDHGRICWRRTGDSASVRQAWNKYWIDARGHDGLEGARREVEGLGGEALMLRADVADPEQVEAAIARAEAELGPIDILITTRWLPSFPRSKK